MSHPTLVSHLTAARLNTRTGGPRPQHEFGERFGLDLGFERLIPLAEVVRANTVLLEKLTALVAAGAAAGAAATEALAIGMLMGSLLRVVSSMQLRQEGWHFSCERETIMERQVHCQSSD